jgi:hypothetical protein
VTVTTYYRDARMKVTSAEIESDGVCYPLTRLDYVWHRRGRLDASALSRRGLRGLLVVGALLLGVLCAAKTPALLMLGARVQSLLVRLALVVAGSLAFIALLWPLAELVLSGLDHVNVHGVVVHEIWARCGGEDILLLRTSDSLRFGRIYRALERALENHPG